MQIENLLPEFYKNLISEKIISLNITENKVNCENCYRATDYCGKYPYKANLKCCTFQPFIQNFYVGAILADSHLNEGQNNIQSLIEKNQFVLPIGIVASTSYRYKYKSRRREDFGQREDLLCPYYDKTNNNCSIWKFRGVVCTTYFCLSSYGYAGKLFWKNLSNYLSMIEMTLMEECLVMLDFSPRQISELLKFLELKTPIKNKLSTKEIRTYWNSYHEDSQGFFKKCNEIIRNINKSDFQKILGEMAIPLENKVFAAYKSINEYHRQSKKDNIRIRSIS